ncbi:hypothetical protein ART_2906 [Arthrobacter sp. PAMC 25486]|nr:hypothetical protein ART_2906 [Arthrobacter sp. PAMC 25486]
MGIPLFGIVFRRLRTKLVFKNGEGLFVRITNSMPRLNDADAAGRRP